MLLEEFLKPFNLSQTEPAERPGERCNRQRIAIECGAWRRQTYVNPLQLSQGVRLTSSRLRRSDPPHR